MLGIEPRTAFIRVEEWLGMRYLPMACLVLASSLFWAQEPASTPRMAPAPQHPKSTLDDDQTGLPASAAKVAPAEIVITVKGLCGAPATGSDPKPCMTEISREQFEKLADALLSNQSKAKVLQLAKSYPDLLALARAAESRGLDKDERVQERLAFTRLQILSQELLRQIDEETANISQSEIEEYYKSHLSRYESATLDRIYVPLRKNQQPGSEAEMEKVAEGLRTKAAGGGDFFSLQKEAFNAAGVTDVPPNPSLGQMRRNDLPPTQGSAFELKSGEVSQVISDTTGHYIYRLESKQVQPLDKAQEDIRRMLRREHREKAIQAIQQGVSATLNPDYFGADEKSEPVPTAKPK